MTLSEQFMHDLDADLDKRAWRIAHNPGTSPDREERLAREQLRKTLANLLRVR